MDARYYDTYARVEDAHWWFAARRRILARVLDGLPLGPGARVLEVGCATGGNLPLLARYGTLDAVEMDAGAARVARARGVGRVRQGWLPDHMPPAPPYHLVALLDVLEHIPDDRAALAALYGHVQPGGWLVLTVPAYMFLWSPHDEVNHHQRRYRRGALVARVEEVGFRVQHATYFNTLLFPAVAGARLAGKLRPPGTPVSDVDTIPAAPVNALLRRIFAAEGFVVPHLRLPFGVSILVVAQRPI